MGIAALFPCLLAAGCGHAKPPGVEAVPAGLPARPGIYVDINPRWSHDGRRIAFLRATPDRSLQLHVIDEDLERPLALLEAELVSPDRPYSPELRRYSSPDTLAWSPDDRRIAFARIEWFTFEDGERLPGTGLWAIDMLSGRVMPLALHPTRYRSLFYYYHDPQWSPDGRYLAFVGEGINGQRVVCLHPLTGQDAKNVTPRFDANEDSDWPAWEPQITGEEAPAFIFRQGIRRAFSIPTTETLRRVQPGQPHGRSNPRSGQWWRLTAAEYAQRLPAHRAGETVVPRAGHFVWSPDGQTLAFTLTPDANDFTRYELWTLRRDSGEARRVSPADGRGYFAPVWIGNGRLGALSPRGARCAVVTVDIADRTVRTLGEIESADCDWSPDRRRIVYATPAADAPPNPDSPTTLRMFETGISAPPAQPPGQTIAFFRKSSE
jgi:dipeptidyl aminopeptidase/acylaminoacyl peptidase